MPSTTAARRPPLAVDGPAAAELLGIGYTTLRRRIADGTIRAVRLGGRVLVPLTELERLLAGEPMTQRGAA